MPAKKNIKTKNGNGATLDFESQLWAAADKLRGHMDASEYKHVVLGLIFLKYISDSFEEMHAQLQNEKDANPEDRDEYLAQNVFWVPQEARWSFLRGKAKQPEIGKYLDDGMVAIERDNPTLKNILPKDYARPTLDKQRLGELIDLVSRIGLGSSENRAKDILGRVYEYFLSQFASAEGKKGGEFYTPQSVVRVLVEMLAPYKGRVFDPCCGSGGMFVQSEKFVQAHGGKLDDISIFGQESNPTTWKLAKMNLAIRGIESNLGREAADSFHRDLHPDLKADFILANPPFNMSDWGGDRLREDKRWKFGAPPVGNANYAWVQHFIHHLAPNGTAGFVLANGSMSSNTSGEGEIRKALIEADLVDCMVALPGQLFFSTQIPVCLWFLTRDKTLKVSTANPRRVGAAHHVSQDGLANQSENQSGKPLGSERDRRGQTLFIDARKLGSLVDRVHRDLSDEDIAKIAETYHAWKGDLTLDPFAKHPFGAPERRGEYEDIAGFCKSVTLEEIRAQGYVLTPGRYVGAAEIEADDEPFEQKMARLTKELEAQFEESDKLEKVIRANLQKLRGKENESKN
ncbi:MAG: type I restriction-modification system subunit M [Chloroflexi bacterium]|nr:type I restriction-modification system subunit M [Chloroflexota bacterium]